jgi:hypothetical protein
MGDDFAGQAGRLTFGHDLHIAAVRQLTGHATARLCRKVPKQLAVFGLVKFFQRAVADGAANQQLVPAGRYLGESWFLQ